jgi:hypothetical protein
MALRRYAPLGRCMYCLATGVKLSEEHLIPKSLGGRLTLRDAVCEPCRIATGRLEQATLDRDFVVPKTLLALRRRRARGKGPARLPRIGVAVPAHRGGQGLGDKEVDVGAFFGGGAGMDDGGSVPVEAGSDAEEASSVLDLVASEFPRGFALPAFEPAGLLCDTDRTLASPRVEYVACRLQVGAPSRDARATTRPLVDPHAFGYSLAKWAYSYAVAERGVACCDMHAMRQLLAGQRSDVFNFVGTSASREAGRRDWLHSLSLQRRGDWLTVVLNVLGSSGMPPYEVVVGSMNPVHAHGDEQTLEIVARGAACP